MTTPGGAPVYADAWPGVPQLVKHLQFVDPEQSQMQAEELAVVLLSAIEQVAAYTGRTGKSDELIPSSLRWAALIVAKHLFEAQRGGAGGSYGDAPVGFGMPNRARDIMRPYMVVGIV